MVGYAEAYVCGPLVLQESARREWAAAGRAPAGLRVETFANSGRYEDHRGHQAASGPLTAVTVRRPPGSVACHRER
jgi:hypothetical protein